MTWSLRAPKRNNRSQRRSRSCRKPWPRCREHLPTSTNLTGRLLRASMWFRSIKTWLWKCSCSSTQKTPRLKRSIMKRKSISSNKCNWLSGWILWAKRTGMGTKLWSNSNGKGVLRAEAMKNWAHCWTRWMWCTRSSANNLLTMKLHSWLIWTSQRKWWSRWIVSSRDWWNNCLAN